MFEWLEKINTSGAYVVHSAEFDSIELMNLMAPSFVVAVENGDYLVVFDPRSVTSAGFLEKTEDEALKAIREGFSEVLGEKVCVERKHEGEGAVKSVLEDVEFYEGMGVVVLERKGQPVKKNTFEKILRRYTIFNEVSKFSKDQRYTPKELFITVSPGMAGMSVFLTLDTRFIVWLKNETKVEGDKFKYALIRAFNVVVARLTRKFKYERMSILPYESMIIITKDVENVRKFLKAVSLINDKIRDLLLERFPVWTAEMGSFEKTDVLDAMKSKEDFFEAIAAIPDRRGVNNFKSRLVNTIDSFDSQLEVISKELGKWIDDVLSEAI